MTTENNGQTIEQEPQAKGLTAPRVTPADIEANIASVPQTDAPCTFPSCGCAGPATCTR
jgi:hypothetical protein